MSYETSYDKIKNIINLKIFGGMDSMIAEEFDTEVHRLSREKNCKRVLYDFTDAVLTTFTSELLSYSKKLPQVIDPNSAILIAVLVTDAITKEQMEFFAKEANSSGMSIKVFDNKVDAIEWLNEQAKD